MRSLADMAAAGRGAQSSEAGSGCRRCHRRARLGCRRSGRLRHVIRPRPARGSARAQGPSPDARAAPGPPLVVTSPLGLAGGDAIG